MSTSTPTRQGRGFVVSGGAVNHDALLTVTQAATLARVSKQLVNWWRTSGRIRAVKRNGVWRYRLGDVLQVECETRNAPQSHRAA